MNKKRILAVLIVIGVIITSFSIRQSYAKYKSEIDVTDTSRVAKWNINTTQKVDLFSSSEGLNSLDGKKIIAPGSKGSYSFEIVGTAETAYELYFEYEIDDQIGCLKYYLNDGNKTYEYNSLERLFDQLAENVFPMGEVYDPNTVLNHKYTISWEWPADANNEKDSELQQFVKIDPNEEGYENQPHVSFIVKISAEQEVE